MLSRMESARNNGNRKFLLADIKMSKLTSYYAGAKFDTIPTSSILPELPMHWQYNSTPSFPIPIVSNETENTGTRSLISKSKNSRDMLSVQSSSAPCNAIESDPLKAAKQRVRRKFVDRQIQNCKIHSNSGRKKQQRKHDVLGKAPETKKLDSNQASTCQHNSDKSMSSAVHVLPKEAAKVIQQQHLSPRPCHMYESVIMGNHVDISEHLKSLLKVCN